MVAMSDLEMMTQGLRTTSDAIEPAVRAAEDRKVIRGLTVNSAKLNFLQAGALIASISLNGFLGWAVTNPDRQYFASDNGRIFPLKPMSQPYRKPADVIQFARERLNRTFTLDFLNWRQQLEDARPGYTQDGFKSVIPSLQQSGVLETIKTKRMNMSGSSGTGVLTKEGVQNGVYVWYVEVPLELRLSGQTSEMPPQKFIATVRIERISTLDSIEGIGIGQLVTKPL